MATGADLLQFKRIQLNTVSINFFKKILFIIVFKKQKWYKITSCPNTWPKIKTSPSLVPYPTTHGPISSPILPIFVPAQQRAGKPAT